MEPTLIGRSERHPSGSLNGRFEAIRVGLVGILLLPILAGCAGSPISEPFRKAAARQPSFAEISANPESFKGRSVVLGGEIVQTINRPEVTEIEVVQKPLARSDDRPEDTDRTLGRFLIRCRGFLDSAVYAEGREITVAGEIEGRETRPLDQTEYRYPVVGCKQIYLWPTRPPVAYYYPPSYWYDPWWRGWPGYYPYRYPYWYPYW